MKISTIIVCLFFVSCTRISYSTSDNLHDQIKNSVARSFRGDYKINLSSTEINNRMAKAIRLQLQPGADHQVEGIKALIELSQHKVPGASFKIAHYLFDCNNYKICFEWLALGIFESWENSENGLVDNKFIELLNKFPNNTSVRLMKEKFYDLFPPGDKKARVIKTLDIDTDIFSTDKILVECNLMAHYFERILYNINVSGITYSDIHNFSSITKTRLVSIYNHSKAVIGLGYASENLGNDLKAEDRVKKAIEYLSQCSEPTKKLWLGSLYHTQYRLIANHDQIIFSNAVYWLNQNNEINNYDLLGKLYGTRAVQLLNQNSLKMAKYHLNHAFKYFYLALRYDLPEASQNLKITEKIIRDLEFKSDTLAIKDNVLVGENTTISNRYVSEIHGENNKDEKTALINEQPPRQTANNKSTKTHKKSKEEKQADRIKRYKDQMNKDPNLKLDIFNKTQSSDNQTTNFTVGFGSQSVEKDFQKMTKDQTKEKKINALVEDVLFAPWDTNGQGQPEILKHRNKNEPTTYSRRINGKDRLVYQIQEDKIIIISCKGHYN